MRLNEFHMKQMLFDMLHPRTWVTLEKGEMGKVRKSSYDVIQVPARTTLTRLITLCMKPSLYAQRYVRFFYPRVE